MYIFLQTRSFLSDFAPPAYGPAAAHARFRAGRGTREPRRCVGKIRIERERQGPPLHERRPFFFCPAVPGPYPFKPLVAMPWTNFFWKMRNTTITGIRDTTEAAMMRPYSEEYWPMNIRMPSWTVFSSVEFK